MCYFTQLRKMLFGIYLDAANPDVMEEVYEFRVSYPADGLTSVSIAKVKWMHKLTIQLISQKKDNVEVMTAQTKKEIKKATQSMMRTLITLTQTLKSLPGMRNKFYYFVAFNLSQTIVRQITARSPCVCTTTRMLRRSTTSHHSSALTRTTVSCLTVPRSR